MPFHRLPDDLYSRILKLAANMWLYQYDFRTPWKIACTNF